MKTVANKKYMIIAVSVLIWKFTARNNFGAARQASNPQSATTYIFGRSLPSTISPPSFSLANHSPCHCYSKYFV